MTAKFAAAAAFVAVMNVVVFGVFLGSNRLIAGNAN